jgi:hypothetical protein
METQEVIPGKTRPKPQPMDLQEAQRLVTDNTADEDRLFQAQTIVSAEKQRQAMARREQSRQQRLEQDVAESEQALAAFTSSKEAIEQLTTDALYRCGGAGLPAALAKAIGETRKRLDRLRRDQNS